MTDFARVVIVVVCAIAQVAASVLPTYFRWGSSVGSRSDQARTPITPPGWVFTIWGPLFAGSIAFAVWQAWPPMATDPVSRKVGWLAAGVFASNTLWQLYVAKRGLDWGSVTILAIGVGLGGLIVRQLPPVGVPDSARDFAVALPLLALAGWMTLAVFVNLVATIQYVGVSGISASSIPLNVVVLVVAGGVLAVMASVLAGGWAYVVPPIRGLIGLMTKGRGRRDRPISLASGVLIGVLAVAAAWGEGWIG